MQNNTGKFVPPVIKTKQCAEYATFTPTPLDGSCKFPDSLDWHLAHSPEHILYTYADVEGEGDGLHTITWEEEVKAIYRAAHLTLALANASEHPKPIFAVLAVADTITFITLICGVIRAGYAPFLPSPRVSAQVLAQLLDAAGATHVIHSADAATAGLARAAAAGRTLVPMPVFDELFDATREVPAPPRVQPGLYDVATTIHSSGSTSVPKLMPLSHFTFMHIGMSFWSNDADVGSMTMNFAALPVYHLMGLAQIMWAAYSGSRLAVFPPRQPPVFPRVEAVLHSVLATRSTFILTMPSLLETVSANPEDIQKLVPLEFVAFGGAALRKSAGDALVQAGVKLIAVWGMSEMGFGTAAMSKPLGMDWQWMRAAEFMTYQYRDLGDGTYELMILSHDGHYIDRPNCEIDGQRALATNDVVIPHPADPGLFKIVGRLDDQIVLSTGEKTNAIPLEGILRSHPLIAHAVVFGQTRPHNGVLIEPHPDHAFDPADATRLNEFLKAVWPTVVEMNKFAPSHSRIVQEMILVASPAKPFAINAVKHAPIRAKVLAAYDKEIDAAYESFEHDSQLQFIPPKSWHMEHALPFVRDVVLRTLPDVQTDDDDFFNIGCDSLKATRIHNNITNILRSTCNLENRLPADLPYKYPTVRRLAEFASSVGLNIASSTESKVAEVEALLAKYTQSFPAHQASESPANHTSGLVFLVTGTTGGLGTNLLAQLLGAPDVAKVYALNRAGKSGTSLLNRHKAAFLDRGAETSLLDSEKFVLLEGNTSREDLGLPAAVYDEMRGSVTHIIHNAWPVNFNYAVQTFEPAIKGTRNLVDLALRSTLPSPPRFMFISSISVSRHVGLPGRIPVEEQILDPGLVIGQGYPESKWIIERMLHAAAERTPLQSVSVRVGQLAGGTSGCWNVTDWVPVIVRSASKLGCLPDCETNSFWVRLDEAAASLIEMRDAVGVLHLVHPRPIPWRTTFNVFAKKLDVPLVPFHEWLARIEAFGEADPEGGRVVPALRLAEFYKELGEAGFGSMSRMENVSTVKAQEVSATLRHMAPLTEADAEKWLAYWQRSGVLP